MRPTLVFTSLIPGTRYDMLHANRLAASLRVCTDVVPMIIPYRKGNKKSQL